MEVLHGLEELERAGARACAATVGVFDGVHLGHFHVLQEVRRRAAALDVIPAVVTFAEHPKSVLVGRSPDTVTSLAHRLLLFERAGIRRTLVLEFTDELRQWTAGEFVRELLLGRMDMKALVLGFDSKFGRDRGGTAESLAPLAAELGFELAEVPPLRLGGRAVSSTAVREAVALGELERGGRMLGRPVSLLGTVVKGDGRGRQIGFPTANLNLHHEMRPPNGVYAALVLLDGELRDAAVNIGTRPTFDTQEAAVEVHVLDFDGDLYGRDLEVFFLAHLRVERKFDGVEQLEAQIAADLAEARARLAAARNDWRIPGEYLPIEGPGPEALAG